MSAFAGDPRLVFCEESVAFSKPVTHLAAAFELIPSKCKLDTSCNDIQIANLLGDRDVAEANRLAKAKGLYLNNSPVASMNYTLNPADLIDGKVAILRTGRAKHLIVALA